MIRGFTAMRRDRIDQLSFDHSLVWELVRRNHLTSEQANLSVPKNVITRSLGPEVEIEVDIEGPLAVELGDVYLLCSDGLSGPVDDQEIGAFAANFHPRDACRYLVNLANLRGGLDNITVLIVRIGQWVDPDSAETSHISSRPRKTIATIADATAGGRASRSWSRGDGRNAELRAGRRSSLSNVRMSDRRGPDRSARRADPQHPGASGRASLVARLDRAGQPETPGRRRARRQESMGLAPQDRRDHLACWARRRGSFARPRGRLRRFIVDPVVAIAAPCLSIERASHVIDRFGSTSSTACARGPIRAESTSPPLVAPLELSTVYCPADLDHVDALNSGEASGFIYARDGHPNAAQLAEKLVRLEGGEAGLVCASGMGAIAAVFLTLLEPKRSCA